MARQPRPGRITGSNTSTRSSRSSRARLGTVLPASARRRTPWASSTRPFHRRDALTRDGRPLLHRAPFPASKRRATPASTSSSTRSFEVSPRAHRGRASRRSCPKPAAPGWSRSRSRSSHPAPRATARIGSQICSGFGPSRSPPSPIEMSALGADVAYMRSWCPPPPTSGCCLRRCRGLYLPRPSRVRPCAGSRPSPVADPRELTNPSIGRLPCIGPRCRSAGGPPHHLIDSPEPSETQPPRHVSTGRRHSSP